MKAACAALLAFALLLPGCGGPTYRLPDRVRERAWDPEQAKDVLRASLEYAGMRHICVGDESFSYVRSISGPMLDSCECCEICYGDIVGVEVGVTRVDYRVVLLLSSCDCPKRIELPFATRRSARNCADAFETLRGMSPRD